MPIGAIAGGVLGSVAASAAGSLVSGALSSGAVNGGAGAASGISQQAVADANANRLADRTTYQPFVDQGTTAVNQLGNVLGLNGSDAASNAISSFQASPGYAYNVSQGLKAVDSGAASRGMLQSGATVRAEQTLGNNLADQDFGNYVNRLSSLGNMGLQGAQGQSNSTNAYNNLLSGQATNQEQIAGQAATQNASIYGNAASGITSAVKSVPWNNLFQSSASGSGTNAAAAADARGFFGGAGGTF